MDDTNFTFDGQRGDENVVLYQHQHPWVLAKAGFIDVILIVIIFLCFLIWGAHTFSFWVLIIGLVIGFVYTFNSVYLFRNALFILTDQRIINIIQSSIFGRRVQETELTNIYNLSYNIDGAVRNFLDFGDIELTTQGDKDDRIILKNISEPHEIFDKLSKTRREACEKSGVDTGTQPVMR